MPEIVDGELSCKPATCDVTPPQLLRAQRCLNHPAGHGRAYLACCSRGACQRPKLQCVPLLVWAAALASLAECTSCSILTAALPSVLPLLPEIHDSAKFELSYGEERSAICCSHLRLAPEQAVHTGDLSACMNDCTPAWLPLYMQARWLLRTAWWVGRAPGCQAAGTAGGHAAVRGSQHAEHDAGGLGELVHMSTCCAPSRDAPRLSGLSTCLLLAALSTLPASWPQVLNSLDNVMLEVRHEAGCCRCPRSCCRRRPLSAPAERPCRCL